MGVSKAQKMRLGVFLALGLSVLGGGLVVLAGMKLGEVRDVYPVRFKDGAVSLSGLDVGSPVKYSGIRVGRVDRIRVDPDDVSVIVVTLSLDGGTPVAEDSVASLGSLGITGLKYVELSRGGSAARRRQPGEEIPAGSSFMDDITEQASSIATKVDAVLERVQSFAAPDMRDRVARSLDSSQKLLETVEGTVSENRPNLQAAGTRILELSSRLETLAGRLETTLARSDRLLAESQPRVIKVLDESATLLAGLNETRTRLDGVLEESRLSLVQARTTLGPEGVGKTLGGIDQLVGRGYLVLLQSQEDIAESTGRLREAAENLSVFSQRIREDPSLLLLGTSEDREGRE